MNSLIGKCGLYCGACTIYRAERDSEELRNKLAKDFNCELGQVRCNGCGSLTVECWGSGCKIVVCAKAKGFDHCFECPEYESGSCEKFESLAGDYLGIGVDLRANPSKIKEGKTSEWLLGSEENFKCKACGKPVCAWFKKCHHCGNEIAR
jgi:hypothetical protein